MQLRSLPNYAKSAQTNDVCVYRLIAKNKCCILARAKMHGINRYKPSEKMKALFADLIEKSKKL